MSYPHNRAQHRACGASPVSTHATRALPCMPQLLTDRVAVRHPALAISRYAAPGRCRPTKRDNCSCIPNAVLLGGGSFRVMPQWRRFTRPGPVVDTTFQVGWEGLGTHSVGGQVWAPAKGMHIMARCEQRVRSKVPQPFGVCACGDSGTGTRAPCAYMAVCTHAKACSSPAPFGSPGVLHRDHFGWLLLQHGGHMRLVGCALQPAAAQLHAVQQHRRDASRAHLHLSEGRSSRLVHDGCHRLPMPACMPPPSPCHDETAAVGCLSCHVRIRLHDACARAVAAVPADIRLSAPGLCTRGVIRKAAAPHGLIFRPRHAPDNTSRG